MGNITKIFLKVKTLKRVWVCILVISLIANLIGIIYIVSTNTIQFPLLSKQINEEDENDLTISFIQLRAQLNNRLQKYDDSFSMYFEYLPTGDSIGINADKSYVPASLIKVPIAIAFFSGVERDHIDIHQTVSLKSSEIDKTFGTLWEKGVGYKISLIELVRIMIENSDNTAVKMLEQYILKNNFQEVFDDLGLPYYDNDKFLVTTRDYASILKSLYYSSILTKNDSETILDYLSHSNFNDDLPAGVSSGVTIAHKIGIDDVHQVYQDCGIIYYPRRPYLLCMISHSDQQEARHRMVRTSRIIYNYIR